MSFIKWVSHVTTINIGYLSPQERKFLLPSEVRLPTPDRHLSAFCHYSFVFVRISCTWNCTICSLLQLASFQLASFFCLYLCLLQLNAQHSWGQRPIFWGMAYFLVEGQGDFLSTSYTLVVLFLWLILKEKNLKVNHHL